MICLPTRILRCFWAPERTYYNFELVYLKVWKQDMFKEIVCMYIWQKKKPIFFKCFIFLTYSMEWQIQDDVCSIFGTNAKSLKYNFTKYMQLPLILCKRQNIKYNLVVSAEKSIAKGNICLEWYIDSDDCIMELRLRSSKTGAHIISDVQPR